MKQLLFWTAFISTAFMTCLFGCKSPEDNKRPNILLIVADDLAFTDYAFLYEKNYTRILNGKLKT